MSKNIVDAILHLEYDDTTYHLPCKANIKTHEVTHIKGRDDIDEDEFDFWSSEIEIDGVRYPFTPLSQIDEILQDNCGMDPIEEYLKLKKDGSYWEKTYEGQSLSQCIRFWRWWELKASIEDNRDAIADFIGAEPDSDAYDKVMDDRTSQAEICEMLDAAEAKMPERKFMRFFKQYDNPNIWDLN